MYLLTMDCAGSACSVALFEGNGVIASRHEIMARGQSERLVPMIGEVLADAGISPQHLNGLAVTVGPGAFTGIRIGLASARAMALALEIPATGVTTFDATVHAFLSDEKIEEQTLLAAILETKRSDFYAQLFHPDGSPVIAGAAMSGEALSRMIDEQISDSCVLIGDGAKRFHDGAPQTGKPMALNPGDGFTAVNVGLCALAGPATGTDSPRPLYLRPPDVTVKPKS